MNWKWSSIKIFDRYLFIIEREFRRENILTS